MNKSTKTVELSPIEIKIAQLAKAKRARQEQEQLTALDNPKVANVHFIKEDSKTINIMIAKISEATDKPIYSGFIYDEITEKIVAIANALQYAKAEARELIPTDYYEIFSRSICDAIIKAYGRLPYHKEPTILTLADGSTKVIGADTVQQALEGTQADIETLKCFVNIIVRELNLLSDVEISQEQFDRAFTTAQARAIAKKELSDLEESLRE